MFERVPRKQPETPKNHTIWALLRHRSIGTRRQATGVIQYRFQLVLARIQTVSTYQRAQYDVARAIDPPESVQMKEFVNNLDADNELAEQSQDYVWHLQTDEGGATSLRLLGEDVLVNLSVWQDVDSLKHNRLHKDFL